MLVLLHPVESGGFGENRFKLNVSKVRYRRVKPRFSVMVLKYFKIIQFVPLINTQIDIIGFHEQLVNVCVPL